MESLRGVRGLVIDLDGTLHVGDEALPGVKDALAALRKAGVPMRFLTNTTSKPRRTIVAKLEAMGLGIEEEAIYTAPAVAAEVLKQRGVQRVYFLLKDAVRADMPDLEAVEKDVQAVVVGDLGEEFSYELLNRAFRHLLDGAEFYALAENRRYRRPEGMCLDVGPFVRALEYAAHREAVLLGKPARVFFETAIGALGLAAHEVASIGDDLEGDVGGGQGAGLKGVLVRTGKFRAADLDASKIKPDLIVDSFADVPGLFD